MQSVHGTAFNLVRGLSCASVLVNLICPRSSFFAFLCLHCNLSKVEGKIIKRLNFWNTHLASNAQSGSLSLSHSYAVFKCLFLSMWGRGKGKERGDLKGAGRGLSIGLEINNEGQHWFLFLFFDFRIDITAFPPPPTTTTTQRKCLWDKR